MTTTADTSPLTARDMFLTTKQVFARYGWGRTKGYLMLQDEDFPNPIGGMYRLDTLYAWEDRQLAASMNPADKPAPAPTPPAPIALPPKKTAGRKKKVNA